MGTAMMASIATAAAQMAAMEPTMLLEARKWKHGLLHDPGIAAAEGARCPARSSWRVRRNVS